MLAPLLHREAEDRQLACTRGDIPRRKKKGNDVSRQARGPAPVRVVAKWGLPGARSMPGAARRMTPGAVQVDPVEFKHVMLTLRPH